MNKEGYHGPTERKEDNNPTKHNHRISLIQLFLQKYFFLMTISELRELFKIAGIANCLTFRINNLRKSFQLLLALISLQCFVLKKMRM